jgi:hypothetical protein
MNGGNMVKGLNKRTFQREFLMTVHMEEGKLEQLQKYEEKKEYWNT